MLVVEGPDGSGKTTLLNRISEDLNQDIAERASSSTSGPVQDLWQWTTADLTKQIQYRQFTIHDRYPLISEPIYGPLVRGKMRPQFDSSWFMESWRGFLRLKPILLFCLPPVDTVIENVQKEDTPQMDGVQFNIRAIYWQYYTLLHRIRAAQDTKTILWNYRSNQSSEHYKIIIEFLRSQKEKYAR